MARNIFPANRSMLFAFLSELTNLKKVGKIKQEHMFWNEI